MQSRNVAAREAFTFLLLTLSLSFLVFWGPLALLKIPTISFVDKTTGPPWAIALYIIGGFVPSLLAITLTWRQEGREGLKRLGRRVMQFKIGWRWYLAIVGIVVLGTAAQIALIHILGGTFDLGLFVAQLPSAIPLIILGPLSEELGWRGYAQDRLQTRWNGLVSGLIVGVVWALWHLPLFYMVGTSQSVLRMPFPGFACGIIAHSVLYAWLHNRTSSSVWTAVFFHWMFTYSAQVVATGVTRSQLYNWLEYVPYILMAIVVAAVWRPWGTRGVVDASAVTGESVGSA